MPKSPDGNSSKAKMSLLRKMTNKMTRRISNQSSKADSDQLDLATLELNNKELARQQTIHLAELATMRQENQHLTGDNLKLRHQNRILLEKCKNLKNHLQNIGNDYLKQIGDTTNKYTDIRIILSDSDEVSLDDSSIVERSVSSVLPIRSSSTAVNDVSVMDAIQEQAEDMSMVTPVDAEVKESLVVNEGASTSASLISEVVDVGNDDNGKSNHVLRTSPSLCSRGSILGIIEENVNDEDEKKVESGSEDDTLVETNVNRQSLDTTSSQNGNRRTGGSTSAVTVDVNRSRKSSSRTVASRGGRRASGTTSRSTSQPSNGKENTSKRSSSSISGENIIGSSSRRKRSTNVVSYKEPSCNKKVRRGDSDWCRS